MSRSIHLCECVRQLSVEGRRGDTKRRSSLGQPMILPTMIMGFTSSHFQHFPKFYPPYRIHQVR